MKSYTDPAADMTRIPSAAWRIPPEWALLQQKIIRTLNEAGIEFTERYTRPDGTLIWRKAWPGMDGSDDPYEGFMHFPFFYMLGGSEELLRLARNMWNVITWQWTEYGQIHREFDAYYDWMHHGESLLFVYYLGLADPASLIDRQRTVNFAKMYMGEDPEADNYDKDKRLIRSPITGSRGPRFDQTAEDWCTHREVLDNYPPPFEDIPGVKYGPKCPWSDDTVYERLLERINARMAKGDVPLNLTATSLATHAYLYTRDDKYRKWVLDYFSAWKERTERNNGITPDNIGLSGKIGENNDGKWWGGYYGWRWPHGSFSIVEPLTIAGCNALLMEGDTGHLDVARSQIDLLWSLRKTVDGKVMVPNKHLDSGWSDYRVMNPWYPLYCWYMSMDDADLERVERIPMEEDWSAARTYKSKGYFGNHGAWFRYIRGGNPDYPAQILRENYSLICEQIDKMRQDQGDPESWDVHHWQERTPMILEGLIQTMLGAPMHIYHGGLMHARVRYFDGAGQRPGLPEGVSALVDTFDKTSVTLTLVNTDASASKEVIVQAGTFGEHRFSRAFAYDSTGTELGHHQIDGKHVRVDLAPGGGVKLRLEMDRYAHAPSYDTPWVTRNDFPPAILGRDN